MKKHKLEVYMRGKTPEEMSEVDKKIAEDSLARAYDILFKLTLKEIGKDKKLKEFPDGYHPEGEHDCYICGETMSDKEAWHDKWGTKCLICQEAVNTKQIPHYVGKHRGSWYSYNDLEWLLDLDRRVVDKLLNKEIIRCRDIMNVDGSIRLRLFLLEDNRGVLPPKGLLKSRNILVKDEEGIEWLKSEEWYTFEDLREKVSGYEIYNFLNS